MIELNLDYDITCDNLVDIDVTIPGFEVETKEFYNQNGELEERKVLVDNRFPLNADPPVQIMKTKSDGRYVLEVECDYEVEYFYSYDIKDLIKNEY